MNWPTGKPLDAGMNRDPVTFARQVDFADDVFEPSSDELSQVYTPRECLSRHLKTWGRKNGMTTTHDPHWLCLTQGTSLHTDPRYPRHTHQLYVKVDGLTLHGVAFHRTILRRGLYVRLDTHSPHKVSKLAKDATWYVAAAIDSHEPEDFDVMFPALMDYIRTASFVPGA